MKAIYVQRGEYIDYTPENKVNAGDVVLLGTLAAVAKLDIEAGKLGALATGGVYDVAKDTNAISLGAKAYWTGTEATASADNGLAGADKVEYTPVGVAVQAAEASDATVRVLLNA